MSLLPMKMCKPSNFYTTRVYSKQARSDVHKDFILPFLFFGLWKHNFDHFVILIFGKQNYLRDIKTLKQNVNSLG